MKLSKTMERAYRKLNNDWASAYNLEERISTLDALLARGLAEKKVEPGYLFCPAVHTKYRLKPSEDRQ